jgi:transcription termination factor Rho
MNIHELKSMSTPQLADLAESLGIENAHNTRRSRLTSKIIEKKLETGENITATGILEASGDFGFLRDPLDNFLPGDEDIYIPPALIRRNNLRTGDEIEVEIRPPAPQEVRQKDGRPKEDKLAAGRVISIHGQAPESNRNIPQFEDLTPLHPNRLMRLERPIKADENITGRLIDLFAPIGFGQRALLVAPPKSGKTVMMQHIAHAISSNHPNAHLIVLLIDERPEEVTEMARSVKGEVFSSTFDQEARRHVELAEMVIERAKRLVERKKDVVILLDSITRLARAYNTTSPSSGKILSGGVEANALTRPKRFFGSARNLEQGGSLTIVSTALVETGSRMDEVIYEEFKGTGNMEIHLERKLMERRVYPAVNINRSGTRREELLLDPSIMHKIWILRKLTHEMDEIKATEFVLDKLKETKTNVDFLDGMRR